MLCAVDWIGISSGGQTFFKETIAGEGGTDSTRVAVHAIHQHNAPRCDFDAEALLVEVGIGGGGFDPDHARSVAKAAGAAAKKALTESRIVTHVGVGNGTVEKVASNRRIQDESGQVIVTCYTATKDPKVRAMPVGTIDPEWKMITFWNESEAIAALTYYATHPQSYYGTGLANPDFPV